MEEIRVEIFKGQPVYWATARRTPNGIQVSKFMLIIGYIEVDVWHLLNDDHKKKVIEYLKTEMK